ncbi:response regulator transcription factor [Thermicanus aegyptius]|uniref:response regulator transcription factor n=1 Tax=Thermicanus aegyptius TaxID=94009 RepID=UPI001FDFF327|nr:helix-turn-helix transcriptional regulator [Thermicanus aegyptius]
MGLSLTGTSRDATNQRLAKAAMTLQKKFHLTRREMELLKKISLYGYNNRELARALRISEHTVKNHLKNIMIKTRTNSSRELLALILRASLE